MGQIVFALYLAMMGLYCMVAQPSFAVLVRDMQAVSQFVRRWGLFAILPAILLLTFVAYAPSLGHIARADQWYYLLMTMDRESFTDILAHTYSYNRTVSHGDYGLFRPVLFALLAAEKACFGHHFPLWQATGIALHLLVVGLLFWLLRRLAPGRLGLISGVTLFFAVNLANIEMVIWHHINAYMLFLALELGAMLLVHDLITRQVPCPWARSWRLGLAWLLLLVAAFTYEIGPLFALLVAVVLAVAAWQQHGIRHALRVGFCFALVPVVYYGVDQVDRQMHPQTHTGADYGLVARKAPRLATLRNGARYLLFNVVQPFVPTGVSIPNNRTWNQFSRLAFSEPLDTWGWRLDWGLGLIASLAAGTLLMARTGVSLGALLDARLRKQVRPVVLFLVLPAGLMGLHMGVTVLGRLNLRPDILAYSTYYAYLPLMMTLIGLVGLWSLLPAMGWVRRMEVALLVPLLCLTAISGYRLQHQNSRICYYNKRLAEEFAALNEVVARHGKDKGFGLAVERGHTNSQFFDLPLSMILYPSLVGRDNPTHIVTRAEGSKVVQTIEEYRRASDRQPAPPVQLVHVGFKCRVFYHAGQYHGLFEWDRVYDPERKDHIYPIRGASLAEVLARVPQRDAQVAADTLSGRYIPAHLPIEPTGLAYRGYSCYLANEKYHAIPQSEGPLTSIRLLRKEYSAWFVAESLEELQRQIDQAARTAGR